MPAQAIARAMQPGARKAAELPAHLDILETVRRRLGPAPASTPMPSSQPASGISS
jgi:hypothetical protein